MYTFCVLFGCVIFFISALSVVRRKWVNKKRDGNVLKVEWEYFFCVV